MLPSPCEIIESSFHKHHSPKHWYVTLHLNNNNYPLYREQILALAESQDLVEHLLSESLAPLEFDTTIYGAFGFGKSKPSTTFLQWRKSDRLPWGLIIGTLSKEAHGLVVGLDSAHQVWAALKAAYALDSQEWEFHLTQ